MAWVMRGRQSDGSWLCQQCTFHNSANLKSCRMCDAREPPEFNRRLMAKAVSSRPVETKASKPKAKESEKKHPPSATVDLTEEKGQPRSRAGQFSKRAKETKSRARKDLSSEEEEDEEEVSSQEDDEDVVSFIFVLLFLKT